MSWQEIERRWHDFRDWFARDWSIFSDEELDALTGDRDGLISAVADKYDMSRKEAAGEVDHWMSRVIQATSDQTD